MHFAEDHNRGRYSIQAYQTGEIRVNERRLTSSLVLSADVLIDDWEPQQIADLRVEHFETILALSPKIVVLGTGDEQVFPSPALLGPLYQAGIGVEVMDTAAACRTFNILTAEDREVVAALMMIESD